MDNNRRKRKYLDNNIQGRLMLALIVLESLMVLVALAYLYYRFASIIDENIYRIHKAGELAIYWQLFEEMLLVVVLMSVINLIALFIAHLIWTRHIATVIDCFRRAMYAVGNLSLDFVISDQLAERHPLLIQLRHWLVRQRKREHEIQQVISELAKANQSETGKQQQLIKLSKLLGFSQY
jgi:hypothetical protein